MIQLANQPHISVYLGTFDLFWTSIAGHLLSENLSDRKVYATVNFPHKPCFLRMTLFYFLKIFVQSTIGWEISQLQ